MCRSDPQSPINIETSWVTNGNVGCPSIQYLNYDTPANSMKLKNNGNGSKKLLQKTKIFFSEKNEKK